VSETKHVPNAPGRAVLQARILENALQAPGVYRLWFEAGDDIARPDPGQFFQVRPVSGLDPLLPRPLSVHRVEKRDGLLAVALLYRVAGRGTALLSERVAGDRLQVFGPLGSGFAPPAGPGRCALLAGGMGAAPVMFLAEEGLNRGWFGAEEVEIFYGAASRAELHCEETFRSLGVPVSTATDDGSAGFHGTVVDLLAKRGAQGKAPRWICAVGPEPMYAALGRTALAPDARVQVSLERRMACGVGACRACVTRVRMQEGVRYADVCGTGPVFDLKEMELNGME
jgi:dihydroorotate dehydrogenase electron transfer subunit